MNILANETDSLKAISEFKDDGLQIIVVLINDRGFFDEWQKPEMPTIESVDTYKRGDQVIPIIIFGTDRKDENGNADLTYDIIIKKPDGAIYGEFNQLNVWKDEEASVMHLVKQPIIIGIEEKDPLGIYTIDISVYENVKKQKIDFKLLFQVI